MKRLLLCLTVLFVALSCATSDAKTPDGQTPAEEMICDDLSGAAFGLCNAYCEATDCGDEVNNANPRACQSLRKNWAKQTGLAEFPCDCVEPEVFVAGEGCRCLGPDLVVSSIELGDSPVVCPTGPGSCVHEFEVEVTNASGVDVLESFEVMVVLPNVDLATVYNVPGLPAGFSDVMTVVLGEGDNCFNGVCEVMVIVDPTDAIAECDEANTFTAEFLG